MPNQRKYRKLGGDVPSPQSVQRLDDEQRKARDNSRYVDDLVHRPMGSKEKIDSAMFFMPELKKVLKYIDTESARCAHLTDPSEYQLYMGLIKSYDIKTLKNMGVDDEALPILLRMIADARSKLQQCCPRCATITGGRRTRKRTLRTKKRTPRTRKRRSTRAKRKNRISKRKR